MLVQRRRRWTNVIPTLIQRLVSAGKHYIGSMVVQHLIKIVDLFCWLGTYLRDTIPSRRDVFCTLSTEIAHYLPYLDVFKITFQQTRHMEPMLVECLSSVVGQR